MTNYGHGNAIGDHERNVTPNLELLGRTSFSFSEIFLITIDFFETFELNFTLIIYHQYKRN